MAVYKLRVFLEDDENIYRDIEIKSVQSLITLQPVINKAFGQKITKNASFYKSDDSWRKKKKMPTNKETPISKFMEHPHQKIIFEIPQSLFGNYLIELIEIDTSIKNGVAYPRCVKSSGLLPGQLSDDDSEFDTEIIHDDTQIDDEFDDFNVIDDSPDRY